MREISPFFLSPCQNPAPLIPCIGTLPYTGSLRILIVLHAIQLHFLENKEKSPEIEGALSRIAKKLK